MWSSNRSEATSGLCVRGRGRERSATTNEERWRPPPVLGEILLQLPRAFRQRAWIGELLDLFPAVGVRDHQLVVMPVTLPADFEVQLLALLLKKPQHRLRLYRSMTARL